MISIGRPGGDQLYIQEAPEFTTVFCPEVGWETARDGFCVACGATDHAKENPAVGDKVYAKWAVGPIQRGSGWVDLRFVEGPLDEYIVTEIWAFGYYVRPVNGQINIGITRTQFEVVPR